MWWESRPRALRDSPRPFALSRPSSTASRDAGSRHAARATEQHWRAPPSTSRAAGSPAAPTAR
eukprot:CAMPEP_0196679856 /NCGR_PEP_ID=MMETSP1090-20130531/7389_1 /TAXON_ID=37098 /ORGANISM="Isochrysis sp, Strain CCMP1244" /LENGTH=62 /DNA_ID=CAMNT_0042018127 /DNA_START=69 /DNA_END=254 /DNA_ORIENTATION=-